MLRIVHHNEKGGVGRTTSTVSLGSFLAAENKKAVLLIDTDPQANSTISLGLEPCDSFAKLIIDNEPFHKLIRQARPGLYVLPTDHSNHRVNDHLAKYPGYENILETAFRKFDDFDFVLVDTSPSSDWLQVRLISMADYLIIPTTLDFLGLRGVTNTLNIVASMKTHLSRRPLKWRILPNMVEIKTRESKLRLKELEQHFGLENLLPFIPSDTRVREASARGLSIWEYAPKCRAINGIDLQSNYSGQHNHYGGYLHMVERLAMDLSWRLQRGS